MQLQRAANRAVVVLICCFSVSLAAKQILLANKTPCNLEIHFKFSSFVQTITCKLLPHQEQRIDIPPRPMIPKTIMVAMRHNNEVLDNFAFDYINESGPGLNQVRSSHKIDEVVAEPTSFIFVLEQIINESNSLLAGPVVVYSEVVKTIWGSGAPLAPHGEEHGAKIIKIAASKEFSLFRK